MDKFTKIVATLGPATEAESSIAKLISAGVDVFRFNFKHGTLDWHNKTIQRVNNIAKKLNKSVGTLIDLQGPEIRLIMSQDEIDVSINEEIPFGKDAIKSVGTKGISFTHPQIIPYLKDNQKIIIDAGAFEFILNKKGRRHFLLSLSKGELKNKKSVTIPGSNFPAPVLVERDFEGLKLAARHDVDFVALSFVRSAKDIQLVREKMKKYSVTAKIVAKIETKKAIDDLDNIIEAADLVMVARGDLGVEMPLEEVPYYQKTIIKKSIQRNKPVITATQMLQSMEHHPHPTRAEVSDIANATYDLTDAVMLSGETALGEYPVEAVKFMSKTIAFNEKKNMVDSRVRFSFELKDYEELLADSAYGLLLKTQKNKLPISGFLVFSETGRMARLVSRYRPQVPIFAFVPSTTVGEALTVNYAVKAFVHRIPEGQGEILQSDVRKAIENLLSQNLIKRKDSLIVLHGDYWGITGSISTITIVTV